MTHAASLSPNTAKYHYDLGVILQETSSLTEASSHYQAATHIQPAYLEAWENYAVCLADLGKHEEAVEAYSKALAIQPNSLISLSNFATTQRWLGNDDEALMLLKRALSINPVETTIREKYSQLLLSQGKFESGWIEYSWRTYTLDYFTHVKNFIPIPKWSGQPLAGKHLIIHSEQGIGDEIMFIACIDRLLALPVSRLSLICDPRITGIIRRSFPTINVYPSEELDWGTYGENIEADFRVPLGDLPGFFRPTQKDFTDNSPYLTADPHQVKEWSSRLHMLGNSKKIGISWRGSKDHRISAARSIPLSLWHGILEQKECVFINLQYGDCKEEIEQLPENIQDKLITLKEIDPLHDLESFCSLIKCLDLVISVDNSTVHFSGAIGTPTWLLLPALADFRWTLGIPND